MKFSARLLIIAFAFLLFSFLPKTTFAQNLNYQNSNGYQNFVSETNPDVPKNLSTYSQSVFLELLGAVGCQLGGINPINGSDKCLGYDNKTGKIGYVKSNGGLVNFMGNMVAVLYIPPAHASDYFRYLAGNFGISKGAYAQYQGVGIQSIQPISGLWVTFRNISYLLFVIIFVFIGLGIMLRLRIDPRTVMTIQNQIPKIIIGILLITFSFAIAGFLIDLMWVLMFVVVNILTSAHPQLLTVLKQSSYVTTFSMSDVAGGFFGIANGTAGVLGGGVYNTFTADKVSGVVTLPGTTDCGFLAWDCISKLDFGSLIASTIGPIINALIGAILGIIVGTFVWFIVIIAIIWALFKLWFALLKAYISILFAIIFAPFWIIAGLLPGVGPNTGFSGWIRDLAANLMAFPVVIALFMIAKILADGFASTPNFFMPPLLGNPGGSFGAVIAFGIIMMSPNVVTMVKNAFKSPSLDGRGVEQGVQFGGAVFMAGGPRFWRGMTRRPGPGVSAGPLRTGAAYLLGTSRSRTNITINAANATPRWYNAGGRLNRHQIASNLLGLEKPEKLSNVSGAPSSGGGGSTGGGTPTGGGNAGGGGAPGTT